MRNKIANINNVSDKGLILISEIAKLNDLVRLLILDPSQDILDKISTQAGHMESSMALYQNEVVNAVQNLVQDNDEEETKVLPEENGFRLK